MSGLRDVFSKKLALLVFDSSDVLSQNLYFCTHKHKRWERILEEYKYLKYFLATTMLRDLSGNHNIPEYEILKQTDSYLQYPEHIGKDFMWETPFDMHEYDVRFMSYHVIYSKRHDTNDVYDAFFERTEIDTLDFEQQEDILEIIKKTEKHLKAEIYALLEECRKSSFFGIKIIAVVFAVVCLLCVFIYLILNKIENPSLATWLIVIGCLSPVLIGAWRENMESELTRKFIFMFVVGFGIAIWSIPHLIEFFKDLGLDALGMLFVLFGGYWFCDYVYGKIKK